MPAEANAVADFHVDHMIAHGCHFSDCLMAGHKRKLSHSPLVVHHAQIAVADAA